MHWYGKLSKKFSDFESRMCQHFSPKALIDDKKLKSKKPSSHYKIKVVKVQNFMFGGNLSQIVDKLELQESHLQCHLLSNSGITNTDKFSLSHILCILVD